MGFKIDLEICGQSVECKAEIAKCGVFDYSYNGFEIASLVIVENSGYSDITGITDIDEINKFIIDSYLESVGE